MIKKIINILKKFILAVLFIYTYNKLTIPLNIYIPINFFTVFFVSVCGIPSILVLILFSLLYL